MLRDEDIGEVYGLHLSNTREFVLLQQSTRKSVDIIWLSVQKCLPFSPYWIYPCGIIYQLEIVIFGLSRRNGMVLHGQAEIIIKNSYLSKIFGSKVKKNTKSLSKIHFFEISTVFDHVWSTSDARTSMFCPVLVYSVIKGIDLAYWNWESCDLHKYERSLSQSAKPNLDGPLSTLPPFNMRDGRRSTEIWHFKSWTKDWKKSLKLTSKEGVSHWLWTDDFLPNFASETRMEGRKLTTIDESIQINDLLFTGFKSNFTTLGV